MALDRLVDDQVYRLLFALPGAIEDIENPSIAELNANPTNDPDGLIFNLTCALDTGSSQFDLDDAEVDDSTTFCQKAGSGDPISQSATVVFGYNMAKARWLDGTSTDPADGFNTATLAHSLLAWRGVGGYAILSIGESEDTPFAIDDRLKIAQVATDHAIPEIGTGENVKFVQTFAKRSDLAWNVKAVA